MKNEKTRLDLLVTERGLLPTRAKAQAAIMAGQIFINGKPATKAGIELPMDAAIELKAPDCPFVSRGGLKLQAALKEFKISVKDRMCLDVGASTGGFTDCLLKAGAARIYAVDVGHGQLDSKLRNHPQVVCLEKINARYLKTELFNPPPSFATIDTSFISLKKVLLPIASCLIYPFEIVALIKPQFELEPKKAPKGVVRKEEDRREAIRSLREFLATLPMKEAGLIPSPILGSKGNREYLWYLKEGR
ncbi:MAG: TlyA family RNA methyltransferase [Elusimicrobia bacterium]|nr:TlyA family RNA methyltransferase [Elusimicrobiota bacterium]